MNGSNHQKKLNEKKLPDYQHWFSKLQNKFILSEQELEECRKIWKERKMKTFSDWLKYYNNLNVTPFLQALENMRDLYATYKIDIFKDAVSLPGIALKYILRSCLPEINPRSEPVLFAPKDEAYDMLKKSMTGGPSIVFTIYHAAGLTKIRSHKLNNPKISKKVIGYDANALYPSTMLGDMPLGRGKVTIKTCLDSFLANLETGRWFGFAELQL